MVKTFQAYLPSCHRTYSCIHCRAHLANHDELISKVSRIPLPIVPRFSSPLSIPPRPLARTNAREFSRAGDSIQCSSLSLLVTRNYVGEITSHPFLFSFLSYVAVLPGQSRSCLSLQFRVSIEVHTTCNAYADVPS